MSLSVVYPPRGSTTACTLDIVAIHGLGGDAIDTWTHPKSSAFWLKDFLPQKVDSTRILTFGYNASAAFGQSTADVVDHAKSLLSSLVDKRDEEDEVDRPIIFIAHSLGGIVVKQALLQARLEPRHKSIQDATLGIFFFGTPHRGSEKATYGKLLAMVAQKLTRRPSSRLIKALETNSDELLRLTSDFRHQLPRYRIVSFYEQRPIPPFDSLIVEKHSALLEVENEDQVPVDADHGEMCKFKTEDDDTFERVWKRIERIRKTSQRASEAEIAPRNKYFLTTHHLSPQFTGQEQIGQRLKTAFTPSEYGQSIQRRFVLFGMGGSGKTQICMKYIQSYRERYWGVFWIDASSHESIRQSITEIAIALKLAQNTESVRRELTNEPRMWMLVFDNADNLEISLTEYFPTGGRGDLIITSRNPSCQQYNTVGSEEVGQMTRSDARDLLLKTAYGRVDVTEGVAEAGEEIIDVLGCLALAIAQAGAYIRQTANTLKDYLLTYHRRQKELLSFFPKHSGTDYRYTVYTTWQVSVDMIASKPEREAMDALRILRLVCFFHHDSIPLNVLYVASQSKLKSKDDPAWLQWPLALTDVLDVRHAIRTSVALLASFSLVRSEAADSLSLHPLVHEWCRMRIGEGEDQRRCCWRAMSVLGRSMPFEFSAEDFAHRRSSVTHIQACLHHWHHVNGKVVVSLSRIWGNFILALSESGFMSEAIQLEERVLELQMSKRGAEHFDTMSSMNNLAAWYHNVGRWEEAVKLNEAVLELCKCKLGAEDLTTITCMNNLATTYEKVERREEALELQEEVVRLNKSKPGAEDRQTFMSMSNLANMYGEMGRRREALHPSEEVTQQCKSKLGIGHPDTLTAMTSLAARYDEVGRHVEAIQLSEEVLQLQSSTLGAKHPDTLKSMINLAVRYDEAGRRKEGLKLSEEVVHLNRSTLGVEHPHTLTAMNGLAVRYSMTGRRDEALELTKQVVQLRTRTLGAEHPDTLQAADNLAFLQDKGEEVLQGWEMVAQVLKSELGPDHP